MKELRYQINSNCAKNHKGHTKRVIDTRSAFAFFQKVFNFKTVSVRLRAVYLSVFGFYYLKDSLKFVKISG
jgi:hypothetical protein